MSANGRTSTPRRSETLRNLATRAAPGPTYTPQYKLADQAKADALDREAEAALAAGNHAGLVGDDYIRITVFLAAVLFLVGIASAFQLHTIR
jgi:hypothetical protein